MAKQQQKAQEQVKHYAAVMRKRGDMTPEQKDAAIEKYTKRVTGGKASTKTD